MSKGTAIAIGFEFFDGEGDASYEDEYEFYTVCLTKNTANARDIELLLRKLFDEHASARAVKGLDSPSCVEINLPFLCDPSVDPPRYMKMAHAIAHAVEQVRGNIRFERMSLLFEDVGIEDLWAWLPTLPGSIESLEIGMCAPGNRVVPSAVWESLPRLQKIEVYTSRTKDGKIGPEVIFERPKASHPRDDEHGAADKRARTEAVDFATSAAKAFVVLPDDDDDPLAETYSIVLDPEEEDEFVFRAIAHEKIPKEGAHKLLGCNFERVRISKDMRKFFREYAFVDEEGKMRNGAKFNNNASALTGMTLRDPLFGRVVFVKK